MKITIYGAGYVGLVYAGVFAEAGYQVVCVDIDHEKIDLLQQGILSIYEPGLEVLIKNGLKDKRLVFTTDMQQGVLFSEIQFVAVGTPSLPDGGADLQYVVAVANAIATHMEENKIIINKSTVPIGTADQVQDIVETILHKRSKNYAVTVVSNPEFLKEGSAVADCQKPDRIVIGTKDRHAEELLRTLYAPFSRNHDKIIVMDARSAELTKYAANCMLATKISLMNELANVAERVGANIEQVRHGIGSDPRIGYQFIYSGIGYGGSCFPKDVRALIHLSESLDFDAKILKAVEARNNQQKEVLYQKMSQHFNQNLKNKVIALWGLSFKPNTSDVREAPSRVIMEKLWAAGAIIQAFDPVAHQEINHIYGERDDLKLCSSKEEALKNADALVIATEWSAFRVPDYNLIKQTLKNPVIFDGRNLYEPGLMTKLGFVYYSIGRS